MESYKNIPVLYEVAERTLDSHSIFHRARMGKSAKLRGAPI